MQIAVIYNPMAGSFRRRNRLRQLQSCLREYGHVISLLATTAPGDATKLAKSAVADGAEVVVAVGGDGTINEVIQGLAGSETPLAVYPAGTTNVWCSQIGMPTDPRQAAQVIHTGPRRTIDLGLAGDRYFLLMAGIGIDAEVTRSVNLELKRRFGMLAYALTALRLGFAFPRTLAHIVLEPGSPQERSFHSQFSLIVVTNAERYAIVKLAPEAQIDDGQLELLVFQSTTPFERLVGVISVLFNLGQNVAQVKRYRVRRAHIKTNPSVAVQLDGDAAGMVGSSPFEISCIPAALHVIVPTNAPTHLFSQQ